MPKPRPIPSKAIVNSFLGLGSQSYAFHPLSGYQRVGSINHHLGGRCVLGAASASALAGRAGAFAFSTAAVAVSLAILRNDFHFSRLSSDTAGLLVGVLLASLEIGQVAGFVVDIEDLLVALLVEASQLLTGWGAQSLLKVRVHGAPASGSLLGNSVLGIDSLSLLGCLVLAVKVVESRQEAVADTMLVVKS